jgi:hypothetical protein
VKAASNHESQHTVAEKLAQISQAIDALRRILPQEISPPNARSSSGKNKHEGAAVTMRDLAAAFSEITRMKEILANEASEVSSEFAAALSHYKCLLNQFKAELPRVQGWLLAERARLASKRSHSEAVGNWARTTRQIR